MKGIQLTAFELRMMRINSGLSPEELGQEIGISGRTIRRLEQGTKPTLSTAKKVSDHFGQKVTAMWPELATDDKVPA